MKKNIKKKVVKKSKKKVIRKTQKERKSRAKIEPDQLLLQARRILIFGTINEQIASSVIKQLLTLDRLSNEPITIMINSGGGSVNDGFAIIDTINVINAPVVTMIVGEACSMAGLISISGKARLMTEHSVWMAHDVATGNIDYVSKYLARADYSKEVQKRCFAHLSKYTKLSQVDLDKARNEELWIFAEDCKKKGIVEGVIK